EWPSSAGSAAGSASGVRVFTFGVGSGSGYAPSPMTPGKGDPCAGGPSAARPISARSTRVVPDYLYEETLCEPSWFADRRSVVKEPTEYPANGSSSRHAPPGPRTRPTVCEPALESRRTRENNGQASRLISTGQLHASRRFHTQPIAWSSSRSL